MNTTSIIIGLGFLAMFIIPLVIISNAGKNRKKKLFKELSAFASENSGKISEFEHWKKSCIGIDNDNFKIYYIGHVSKQKVRQDIDLRNVLKCKHSGLDNSTVKSIGLNFILRNPANKIISLEFFNTSVDTYIVEEDLKLPEKWLGIVNLKLDALPKAQV